MSVKTHSSTFAVCKLCAIFRCLAKSFSGLLGSSDSSICSPVSPPKAVVSPASWGHGQRVMFEVALVSVLVNFSGLVYFRVGAPASGVPDFPSDVFIRRVTWLVLTCPAVGASSMK